MKKIFILVYLLVFIPFYSLKAQETNIIQITGQVTDQESKTPLPG